MNTVRCKLEKLSFYITRMIFIHYAVLLEIAENLSSNTMLCVQMNSVLLSKEVHTKVNNLSGFVENFNKEGLNGK